MTDHELLELAAKAAGVDVSEDRPGKLFLPNPKGRCFLGKEWNPLADDGDALRLVVNLCLELRQSKVLADTMVHRDFDSACVEKWGDDKYAATRRAIVRAAAEIGRRK